MTEHIKTDDNVYFTANFYHPVSGFSYVADATPRWYVYESGATQILNGNMTVTAGIIGSYWGNFIASAANGFVSNRFYDVQISGTVGGVSGFAKVKDFVLDDIFDANVVQVSGVYKSIENFNSPIPSSISSSTFNPNSINATILADDTLTVNKIALNAITSSRIAADAITASQLSSTATSEIASGVWTLLISQHQVLGTMGYALNVASGNLIGAAGGATASDIWGATLASYQVQGTTGYALNVASGNLIGGAGTAPTAIAIRQEMDANSLMFAAVSGEVAGLDGYNVKTNLMAVSGVINVIAGDVVNLDGAAMRGTDNAALATNLNAVSGVLTARTLVAASYFDPAVDTVVNVTNVATVTNGPTLSHLMSVSGVVNTTSNNVINIDSDIVALSGSIIRANVVQVSGVWAGGAATVNVNVVQVSGNYVSIEDFQGSTSSAPTVGEIRAEMDANSKMFVAISGEVVGLDGYALRTNLMAVSGVINTIAGDVVNLDGAAMRGTDNAATYVQLTSISGSILQTNIIQVSGVNVSIENFRNSLTTTDLYNQASGALVAYDPPTYNEMLIRTLPSGEYGISTLTAAAVRTEMDANSLMLSAISGQALTAEDVRIELDANSLQLTAISGNVVDLNSNIYFAHIKFVSDLSNSQDEFVVQWFKNDQPVGSGDLTNPRLSVHNTSNGTALIDSVSMNYASSNLGVVRYDTSMVLASGEPYLVTTSGTIDAATRSWKTIVGIDLI